MIHKWYYSLCFCSILTAMGKNLISEIAMESLQSMYISTNGANWRWNNASSVDLGTAWNFTKEGGTYITSACNNWQGVCCASEFVVPTIKCEPFANYVTISNDYEPARSEDYIVALFLMGMELDGTVSSEVFNITSIQYFRVSENVRLIGEIPSSISHMTNTTYLEFAYNSLSGTIPSVGTLTSLSYLNLNSNRLVGTLPSLEGLVLLKSLDINNNNIRGSIPTLSNLTSIVNLYLYNNLLEGTLPSLTGLINLQYFEVNNNNIGGTIPDLAGLTSLSSLYLSVNNIVGTIPALAGLTALQSLDLNNNILEGTIPPLTGLSSLAYVYLYSNYLVGTIPSLANLTLLTYLYLDNNSLCGTIPDLSGLSLLTYLYLYDNYLSGTIPSLTGLTSLQYVTMENNHLIGTIPSLSDLSLLGNIDLHNNYLDGSIPYLLNLTSLVYLYLENNNLVDDIPEMSLLHNLLDVVVNSNMFSTSLPDFSRFPSSLQYLSLDSNYFHGTVSTSISQLNNLTVINLQNNLLTGQLPSALSALTALNSLFVRDNFFTGSPRNFYPPSLVNLDISINSFTGSIPCDIFALPKIQHVAMVQNCFSGSLSDCICTSMKSLESLALDGLTSGQGCRVSLLWGITDTFTVERFMQGSVPSCLFEMSKLLSLGLSGNGLTGNFPDDVGFTYSSSIRNITVSNNQFGGAIPQALQSKPLTVLDLSYNKLSGTISGLAEYFSAYYSTAYPFGSVSNKSLSLQVNRLSGLIPFQFHGVKNISVVSGNLFDCARQSELPENDPGSPHTQCGSYDLNVGLGLWSAMVVAVILLLILFSVAMTDVKCKDLLGLINNPLLNMITGPMLEHAFHWTAQMSRHYILWLSIAIVVYLPVEIILKIVKNHQYSTHTFQYAYTPSMAFLVGTAGAAVILAFTVTIMTIVWFMIISSRIEVAKEMETASFIPKLYASMLWACVILVDAVAMITVNSCYIAISLYYTQTESNIAVVALVMFKLIWNARILTMAVNYVEFSAVHNPVSSGSMMAWLVLFNNVLVPIIVTMCTQPLCFYNVFVAASDVSANVQYTVPDPFDHFVLYIPQLDILSYQPPFIYSYQCSSSLLTYYLPMYVVMYMYQGVCAPLLTLAVTRLNETPECTAHWVKHVLRLMGCDLMQSKQYHIDYHQLCDGDLTHKSSSLLMNMRDVAAVLTCHLATMLTFGLAYPLLSVLIAFAGCVEIVQWRVLVGRYLSFCRDEAIAADKRAAMIARLERSCAGVSDMLHQSRWLLLVAMSLFFSLFLLDMAGDEAAGDWREMLWAPLTLLLWPLSLMMCEVVMKSLCLSSRVRQESSRSMRGVSMMESVMKLLRTETMDDNNSENNDLSSTANTLNAHLI